MGNHAGTAELAREEFRSCRSSGIAEWTFEFLASGRSHALSEKILGHILSIQSVSMIPSLRQVPPATPELLQLLNS
jgi:hypothetical protein